MRAIRLGQPCVQSTGSITDIAALEVLCQHHDHPVLQFVLMLRRAVSSQADDDIAAVRAMIADPDPVVREVLEDVFWIEPEEPAAPAPA